MIKNVIFDVCGVIVKFDIIGAFNIFGWDKDLKKEIAEIIFQDKDNQMHLEGKWDTLEYIKALVKKYPKYKKEINAVFTDEFFRKLMLPNEETYNLLKELSKHYNVYILSNLYSFMLKRFNEMFGDIDEYVKGALFSCDAGLKKPDPKFFNLFLQTYNINPKESIFIDDTKENIIAATSKEIGIKVGFVYESPEKSNSKINALLLKDFQPTIKISEKNEKSLKVPEESEKLL